MRYINQLTARMPDRGAVLSIYSVLVCLLYSWTLFASFFAFPSWIFYLDLTQLASLYSYSFVLSFIESIFALIIVLFLEFLWVNIAGVHHEDFRSRTVMYILVLLTSSVIRLYNSRGYESITKFLDGEGMWWVGTFLAAIGMALAAPRIAWLRSVLEGFADRAIIFLYIYLPLSLISLVIVVMRNIF
jgi:hypothetical protein